MWDRGFARREEAMSETNDKFARAMAGIDAFNSGDPNRLTVDGQSVAKELYYGRRMSHWLSRLAPDASEALQLAVRAQHIGRWTSPRADYPAGTQGYYRWRRALAAFHAETAGKILSEAGYDTSAVTRIGQLLRKENLKTDPEAQLLEDAACLVFLENFFTDFSRQHDDAKVVDILRKTWSKMSPSGHAAALTLSGALPEDRRRLVESAISGAAA
jgi:hypothetical protein